MAREVDILGMEEQSILEIEIGGIIGIVLLASTFAVLSYFTKPSLPFAVILQVPFTSQAPNGNWNRNEDCEETSITMAMAFLNEQTGDKIPAGDAQNAINQLKAWENTNNGYNADTGASATMKMAEGAFGLQVTELFDYSEVDLKKALSENHPILLPINAKLLNNPKYLNGGPLYHMILLRGYHNGKFIVNDPGTESGDGNEYTFSTLKNAAADWDIATQTMDMTQKIALVLSK